MLAMFASVVTRGCWPVCTAYCSAGQPERVVAHRVQHVVAGHALVTREHVGADVAERMPDVQPLATRVREHVQHVELRRSATASKPSRSGPSGFGAQKVCSVSQWSCHFASISFASRAS